MTDAPCLCRPCQMARMSGVPEADDILLPAQDDLEILPDDMGTEYGEPDEVPTVDDYFSDVAQRTHEAPGNVSAMEQAACNIEKSV